MSHCPFTRPAVFLLLCLPLAAQDNPTTPCPATTQTKKQKFAAILKSIQPGKPGTATDAPKPDCPPAATASASTAPPATGKPVDTTPSTEAPAQPASPYIDKPAPTPSPTPADTSAPLPLAGKGKTTVLHGSIVQKDGGFYYESGGMQTPLTKIGSKDGVDAFLETRFLGGASADPNGVISRTLYHNTRTGELTAFTVLSSIKLQGPMTAPDPTARVNRTGNNGYVDPAPGSVVAQSGPQPINVFRGNGGVISETQSTTSAVIGRSSTPLYTIRFAGAPSEITGFKYYMQTALGSTDPDHPNRQFVQVRNDNSGFTGIVIREARQNGVIEEYNLPVQQQQGQGR